MLTEEQFHALARKAYHPSKLTDRELAQLRRSNRSGAKLLYRVVCEQARRDLLALPPDSKQLGKNLGHRWALGNIAGYWPEKCKRISDYPVDRISPRLF